MVVLVPATGPDVNVVVIRVLVISGGSETVLPLDLTTVEKAEVLVELVVTVDDSTLDKDVVLVIGVAMVTMT